jgi:plasmid stability protein
MADTWHIRYTSRLRAEAEDFAHREGRSIASFLRRCIEEGIQARSKLPASASLPEKFDEKEAFRNSILVRNVPRHLKAALQDFCRAEDRSMTNATRYILAESLKRHGFLDFAALATDSDDESSPS